MRGIAHRVPDDPVDNSPSPAGDLSRVVMMRTSEQSSGGLTADIQIDFAGAIRLARILEGVARELIGGNETLQLSVQDPELRTALEHAEHDWHDQRRRVATFAEEAARGVESAVTAYRDTDAAIARVARTS